MEWTAVITSLIGAVVGGGGMSAFFYRKETKRMKEAEIESKEVDNEHKVAEEWQTISEGKQKRIDHLEETLGKKDEKIEELYVLVGTLREKVDQLSTENAVLKIYKCETIGCPERKPPFGSFDITREYATAKLEK